MGKTTRTNTAVSAPTVAADSGTDTGADAALITQPAPALDEVEDVNVSMPPAVLSHIIGAVLASDDFVLGLKSLVDSHMDANLPELVAAAVPAAPAAPDAAPVVVETPIEKSTRAQNAAEKAAVRHAQEIADQRARAKVEARDNFVALSGTAPTEPEPIDLTTLSGAGLALDDGTSFSIDFALSIGADALSLDDSGAVRLRHGPIEIGDGIDESFPVKGVVLVMRGEEGVRAVRCEMPSVLMVGGGQRAQLSADSLIFRLPRAPK